MFGFLPYSVGAPAVTRQVAVEYLTPALAVVAYRLKASVTRQEDLKFFVAATPKGPDGHTVATSTAVFVTVGVENFARYGSAGRPHRAGASMAASTAV